MSGSVRLAALLVLGCAVLGCSIVTPERSVEPTTVAEPTIMASPTPSPTTPTRQTDPPSLVGLQIDARGVLATPGIDCTGGPVGGEATDSMSYYFWTLHCPAGSGMSTGPATLVDALKAEAERLGATLQDEGVVGSSNAGNSGDQQVTLRYAFERVDVRIRVTFLKEGDGASIVVTIDQQRLA
jgi:hypothetical protein